MNQCVIKIENMWKKYPMYENDFERLKSLFCFWHHPKEFVALENINLELNKGEVIGMIGLNGSGKSTLASIITGITYPSQGTVEVIGEVNMLSANAGMENQLTGLENIKYKGLLMGLGKKEIDAIKDSIIAFADIGSHITQPLRTYSSGMRSRLGFAISVHMSPDILIIDEALSVGDGSFFDKCLEKINEFKEKGKTILFVSHSVMQMEKFCDKIIWLHYGKIIGIEKPEQILKPYCGFAREYNTITGSERESFCPVLSEYQKKYL